MYYQTPIHIRTAAQEREVKTVAFEKVTFGKILHKLGAYPYRPTHHQTLLVSYAERRYAWSTNCHYPDRYPFDIFRIYSVDV